MTVPIDYRRASAEFDHFVADLRDELDLATTHQAWGVLLGVLDTFSRRLTTDEAVAFAHALPPLLRAAFIAETRPDRPRATFADTVTTEAEIMAYHRDHQLARPGCLAATARAFWRHVDAQRVSRALAALPAGAAAFWTVDEQPA